MLPGTIDPDAALSVCMEHLDHMHRFPWEAQCLEKLLEYLAVHYIKCSLQVDINFEEHVVKLSSCLCKNVQCGGFRVSYGEKLVAVGKI